MNFEAIALRLEAIANRNKTKEQEERVMHSWPYFWNMNCTV